LPTQKNFGANWIKQESHRTILKVLVTKLRSDDIAAEREDAERLGVLVFTRENIENAINRSIVIPNAEQMFSEGLESVRSALAKFSSQPSAPGMIRPVDGSSQCAS
jgi:hypothetical protein